MSPSRRHRCGAWLPSARLNPHRVDRRACGSWRKEFQYLLSLFQRPADVSGLRAVGVERELPLRPLAVVQIDSDETEVLIKIPNHGIFRGSDVLCVQYAGTAFARRFD